LAALQNDFVPEHDAGERPCNWRCGAWDSRHARTAILKVARTITDLGESEAVSAKHVAAAVKYRSLDRNYRTQL
jgi:hypothetical protein